MEKVAFLRTKAAISLKRVKTEQKLLVYGRPIETHQRSFVLSKGTIPDPLWPPLVWA